MGTERQTHTFFSKINFSKLCGHTPVTYHKTIQKLVIPLAGIYTQSPTLFDSGIPPIIG